MKKLASDMPIGIFDSGLGGLTVLKELKSQFPNEDFIYLGDTARVPYGNKGKDTIIRYSLENSKFLVSQNAKLIIVACNTASSFALEEIKKNIHVPTVGVVKASAKEAYESSLNKKIAVIGTKGTIKSGAFVKALNELSSKIKVYTRECPLLVPLVEEGLFNHEITKKIIKYYLKPLSEFHIDTLILGCTHYPLIKNALQEEVGSFVKLIESGSAISKEIKLLLDKENLLNDKAGKQNIKYFVTDDKNSFFDLAKIFMNDEKIYIKQI